MFGAVVGAAIGNIVVAAFFSFLAILVGKAFKKRWNGWKVGIGFACIGVLGQVLMANPMGIMGGLLGLMVIIHQSRSFEAEEH